MLNLGPGTILPDREPFNMQNNCWRFDGLAAHWYAYAPGLDQGLASRAARRWERGRPRSMYGRRQLRHWIPVGAWPHRLIVKDPIAALSSEWLSRSTGAQVVVTVRHPAAFAYSLQRMQWHFDFANLLEQPKLMADHLGDLEGLLRNPSTDSVHHAGLLWRCVYTVLGTYLARNQDWILVRHEDLSLRPIDMFRDLYGRLGLRWTGNVKKGIIRHTSTVGNPVEAPPGVKHALKRDSVRNIMTWTNYLSLEQVRALRDLTGPVAARFYDEHEWEM